MPSKTPYQSILKPPRKRSRKLDLSNRRTVAFERRKLSLLTKARLSAASRKPEAFIKRRKAQHESYLRRRV